MSSSIGPYSYKTIAETLNPEISIQSPPSTFGTNAKRGDTIKYSLMDLIFSNFKALDNKMRYVRKDLDNARNYENFRCLKFGATLVSELEEDVKIVSKKIENVIKVCKLMIEKIEPNSTPESISLKNGEVFELKNKEDVENCIKELEQGKTFLNYHFLSETKNEPDFMQVPELKTAYSKHISDFNTSQNQTTMFKSHTEK